MYLQAFALTLGLLLIGSGPGHSHSKGLYKTQEEARKRATEIGCATIHENNGRWMPCADERELHRQMRKH